MDGFDLVVLGLLVGVPLAYLACQILALVRWRGGMRLAAAVPLGGWLAWGLVLVRDTAEDPSSHNILPFEVLIGALAALCFLGMVAALGFVARRAGAA